MSANARGGPVLHQSDGLGHTKGVWRWAGLAAAAAVYLLAILTFGLAFVLAPASTALSAIAIRRLPQLRGWLPWVGLAANILLLVPLGIWVVATLLSGGY